MKKVWDKWTRIALVKRILVGLILGAILGIAVPQATGIAILGDVLCKCVKGNCTLCWYSSWLSVPCVMQENLTEELLRQLSFSICSVQFWQQ